ncbi:uncharacterized protein PITG_15908 [Phytophthora infestans T30-4]|uniref:UDENN domain-containing protein n=1 Tax=Phytophthora infestans (strain T30-4) TaxID=403677 RepID=D0NS13_PHYIT|nr:uncharacterized protein PITG_15908 [Phytophthora infestans T30-4]EEY63554.1 conserved hypothetical protein [Phytophthora infestans T30-4]|eukprot:XP_002898141.1 conserved hypothetical protein [Phytophthora infestans T30-4]
MSKVHVYIGWIPCDYSVEQLKHDVGRYWQLKTSKYELCDEFGNTLPDDKPLKLSHFHPATLTLKRRRRMILSPVKNSTNSSSCDPFWIHDQLFDLFVFNALQNRPSSTLRITGFQFKQLLQKTTAKTIYQQKKKLLFDKQVALAFRGAQSTVSISGDGGAGVDFDEFLDALVDVACFMHPKESSKERSLEKLALEYIIPYHNMEQLAPGSDTLTWNQIEELLKREKVRAVAQRFTKTIANLATSYSPHVGAGHRRCVLRYHEFHRFIRDVIPTTVPISSTELCKVFMRYCRKEQTCSKAQSLEIVCGNMVDAIVYSALVAVPRLVKAKEKMSPSCSDMNLSSKLGVQSLKALLHHISNDLGAKGGSLAKKNVEFNRARVLFLLEFNRMHREDSLVDYQSKSTVEDEFSWNLDLADNAENSGCDSEAGADSPVQRPSVYQLTLMEQRRRDLEQLNALSNEADEIYAFLAGELHRHFLAKRPDTCDTVPHMLDVWVSAGEKYSDVINHVESSPQLRAKFLARFGRSLFVFASQVLRSTTKVYSYEELFYVTNVRVYTTVSDTWSDESTSFTLDLAMETLSLASGKLTQASDELCTLLTTVRKNDGLSENDDDESSIGSEISEDDDDWTASALYERYLYCLYLRANCLAAYADVIAHNKKVGADYELGTKFDETKQIDERSSTSEVFFNSTLVLSKTSPPGEFYWEAKKMFRFLLQHSKGGLNYSQSRLHHNLAMVHFKLATHLPRGCDAEKQLLENALINLDASEQTLEPSVLNDKRSYIRALLAVRRKFFLAESQSSLSVDGEVQQDQEEEEAITPFYRFVLAAAFADFDTDKKGVILQADLTLLSKACGRSAVSVESLQWLLRNFDHQDGGLTERGVLQYFCWLAEADPVSFCEMIDFLTAKHTGAHNISIYSDDSMHPRKHSSLKSSTGVHCVVVLGGKMTKSVGVDVSNTSSLADIRLEPEVVDMLPSRASLPEELSKFCFPDDIYLSTEPFTLKTFDIVLTDVKGVRSYGSCLHFGEEKHPMDVLSLISATEKGRTVHLPPWVSLKDIQQGQTKWKCYAPKCLCVLSSYPLFQTFRSFLVYLYRLSLANSTRVSLESAIFNFLEQIRLPNGNSTQTAFKLAETTCVLSRFPTTLPLFSPTEVDFTIAFQCLNPDNILKVYAYLLTEKKVVLSSANRPILTHVAETLLALLHPFECQQVYIPLLPSSLVEFICAPVPFFMGIRSDERLERLVAEGVILVDLDNNDIRVPPNEELPVLTDVKSRKLLHTLRKLAIWPASQRTRHSFGHCFSTDERPLSPTFEPSQPSAADVVQVISRNDDLTEKWSEIQTLFSSFATRILKDVRKHCTKAGAPGNSSTEAVVFDERGFIAMHPSLRDFCTHLFQTQLFQRSLENIWAFSGTETEQYWKMVRAKGMMRKNSEAVEDANKSQRRRISQAPLPSSKLANSKTTNKLAGDGFPTLNGKLYDDLLEELSEHESSISEDAGQPIRPLASLSSAALSSESSSTSILTTTSFHDGDVDAFQLVNAARKRMEGRRI